MILVDSATFDLSGDGCGDVRTMGSSLQTTPRSLAGLPEPDDAETARLRSIGSGGGKAGNGGVDGRFVVVSGTAFVVFVVATAVLEVGGRPPGRGQYSGAEGFNVLVEEYSGCGAGIGGSI